jgi:Flp pilus assembly protein TadB
MSNPDNRRPSLRSLTRARRLLALLVAIWLVPVIGAIMTGNPILVLFAVIFAPFVVWMALEVRRAARNRNG